MAFSYYVYYRVQPEQSADCEGVVLRLMAAVGKATGVPGRLLAKRDEPNLWMEIYEGVADEAQFEWELAEAVGRSNVQAFLVPGSQRHLECFEEFKK